LTTPTFTIRVDDAGASATTTRIFHEALRMNDIEMNRSAKKFLLPSVMIQT
jgi:hypothetical protein